ncbi:MAG: hypothetical protein AAB551_02395 [Patescibacteria group bacterium]
MENIKTQGQTYAEVQNKIKLLLARELEFHTITVEHVMAILFLLGQTKSVEELEVFIDIFQGTFPVLKTFTFEKAQTTKVHIEEKVRKAALKMITKDPMRAAELAKDALRKDILWDELVQKYPELGQE